MIRLAIRVQREQAELVLAELLELAPSGVEEAEVAPDLVEYAVYGAPGELPELPDLKAAAGGALVEISTSELPDDWSERWKHFHRPVLVERPVDGGGEVPALHIRPPWEAPSDRAGVCEIVIDPAQAFGTGAHATTRLCLELLLELAVQSTNQGAAERGPLLDVGTGSGVLAIAAAKLGYAPVRALDNEIESVEAARENALVNGVDLEVGHFDLRRDQLLWEEPPDSGVMIANLLRPLLLDLARKLPGRPRDLIASGLLAHEVEEIVDAFGARWGLRERARRSGGEWAATWLSVCG
ncbi:MAG TPA: 50S ribosomal protein L11 methyltransferase [Solirubrobacteraceae bacterium]